MNQPDFFASYECFEEWLYHENSDDLALAIPLPFTASVPIVFIFSEDENQFLLNWKIMEEHNTGEVSYRPI